MVDFSKDVVENKKIIVRYTIKLLKIDDFIYTSKDEDVKKLFKSFLDRIYECKLISDGDKNKIKSLSMKYDFSS